MTKPIDAHSWESALNVDCSWPVYADDELDVVREVLKAGKVNYWTGDEGRQFEREYAAHTQVQYGVAVANGTLALELALVAADIGPGDEVIVTPRSFIASASCAISRGATPIFADVDFQSQNLCPKAVAKCVTPRTKAVIAVHHAGWPCEMDELMAIAKQHNLTVIEDCAQAHGAKYKGKPVGGVGHIGAFSFCQDKIISTGGEGGMLVTNDEQMWRKAWSYKDHGKSFDAVFNREHGPGFRWLHESFGSNWRLTEMQSAIGRLQLRKLPAWSQIRTANAKTICAALEQFPAVTVPKVPETVVHAYYRLYFTINVDLLRPGWTRDKIVAAISAAGTPCFSGSCPEIYRELAFDRLGSLPHERLQNAARLGSCSIAMLVHPTLSREKLAETCITLRSVFEQCSR